MHEGPGAARLARFPGGLLVEEAEALDVPVEALVAAGLARRRGALAVAVAGVEASGEDDEALLAALPRLLAVSAPSPGLLLGALHLVAGRDREAARGLVLAHPRALAQAAPVALASGLLEGLGPWSPASEPDAIVLAAELRLVAGDLRGAAGALAALRRGGARGRQAEALRLLGVVRRERGALTAAAALFSAAAARARAAGDFDVALGASLDRAALLRGSGALCAAGAALEEAEAQCAGRPAPEALLREQAALCVARGDRRGGLSSLHRLLEGARGRGDRCAEGWGRAHLALLHAGMGEGDRARSLLAAAQTGAAGLGSLGEVTDWLLLEAAVHRRSFAAAECQASLEAALELARECGHSLREARALASLGDLHYRRGSLAPATSAFEGALTLERRMRRRKGVAELLYRLGNVERTRGRLGRAERRFSAALGGFAAAGHPGGRARCLFARAGVAHACGDDRSALAALDECLVLRRASGERLGVAQVLGEEAVILRDRGELSRALDLFEQSLALRREAGDRYGEAVAQNDQAMIYRYRGEYSRALGLYDESLETKRELGDRFGVALGLNDRALALKDQGAFNEAHACVLEGLRLAEEIDAGLLAVRLRNNLAHLLAFFGDTEQALALVRRNLLDLRRTGCRSEEPKALGVLAEIHRRQGAWPEARRALQRCERLAAARGDRRELAYALLQRGVLEADGGERASALENLTRCRRLREELMDLRGVAEALWREGVLQAGLGAPAAARELLGRAEEVAAAHGFPEPLLAARLGSAGLALAGGEGLEELGALLEELLEEADDLDYVEGLHAAQRLLGALARLEGEPAVALRYFGRALETLERGAWGGGRGPAERELLALCGELLAAMDREQGALEALGAGGAAAPAAGAAGGGVLVCLSLGGGPSADLKGRVALWLESDRLAVPRILSNRGRLEGQLSEVFFVQFDVAADAARAVDELRSHVADAGRRDRLTVSAGAVPAPASPGAALAAMRAGRGLSAEVRGG